ncbi:EAL domain-containing protein [uncultured Desulfuromusa sp.]|uniref:EAL domain-containing protein n=1 Tax=uncultured Desulfuromusa sp. TaxID=219183 RepID=UPI002AA6116B|nr:EAL domain-containing protein [uncultured Desulfuromusa sp.]
MQEERKLFCGLSICPDNAMLLWPIVGVVFTVSLSVLYNELLWGGPLEHHVGYLIPAGVGTLGGFLSAWWYRRYRFYLEETSTRSNNFEKMSRRYELILQSTEEGIFELNQDGICLFINRAAQQILGFSEGELLGQDIHKLIHHCVDEESGKENPNCPLINIFKTHESIHIPDDIKIRKDGSEFIADTFAYPVIDHEKVSVVVMFRDATEERKLQKRIQYMAKFDRLTGLQNRYAFEQCLTAAIANVHSESQQHVLCYIDLDQFKIINDTVGHVAGDAMLQELSLYLNKRIRKGDVLGRLGGDEFGLLLHNCCLEDIHIIIEALQEQVKVFRFQWNDQVFKASLSIGVCLLDESIKDLTQALKCSDQACYMAKESGRDRYHIYNSDDNELRTMNEQMKWVARINQALTEDRFFLRRQAIARLENVQDNQQVQFEVLISMQDETGKTLPPGGFIPAAERYGLMSMIDRWVVKATFDWLENNANLQSTIDFVAINLSGASFSDESFLDFIQSELGDRLFSPDKICFEITETAAMHQMQKAIHFIHEVKKNGCRFALDDFGSGMASFGYLKNFPVDYIKIDGSFVQDLINDPLSRAVVDSIHRIARVMQITTIAEHAEDQETLEALQSIGIDYVQGYIISRPEKLC